jgi:DNA-3-methyladenine glycosylase
MSRRLSTRFFSRPCSEVAPALLGKLIVHGKRRGIIVETEAYLGPDDAASHARFGPTPRNAPMFGPAGVAYVYLCYGVHEMFNIVTGPSGQAEAVLIRAVELLGSDDLRRGAGPGKLTRALELSRRHNSLDLCSSDELYLTQGRQVPKSAVEVGPRIGVDYAGPWAQRPLRFWIRNHKAVSR